MYVSQRSWLENGPASNCKAVRRIQVPGVSRRRGVAGVLDNLQMSQQWCDQAPAWNPVAWFMCLGRDVTNVATGHTSADFYPPPAIPAPAAPTLTTDPAAAALPGAAIAGSDAAGNPVYAVPETPAENMARYTSAADQFFAEQSARTPPSATPYGWLLPVGIAAVALGAFVLIRGHQR